MARPALVVASVKAEALIPGINANHRECTKSGHEALKYAQQAGELLWKLKETVKHGEFEKIVEQRLDFSTRMARSYMKLSEGLPNVLEKLGNEAPSEINAAGALKLISKHTPRKSVKRNRVPKVEPSGGQSKPQQEVEFWELPTVPQPAEEDFVDSSETGKVLTELMKHTGHAVRCLQTLQKSFPGKEYDAINSSLEIAHKEAHDYRSRWRRLKVVV